MDSRRPSGALGPMQRGRGAWEGGKGGSNGERVGSRTIPVQLAAVLPRTVPYAGVATVEAHTPADAKKGGSRAPTACDAGVEGWIAAPPPLPIYPPPETVTRPPANATRSAARPAAAAQTSGPAGAGLPSRCRCQTTGPRQPPRLVPLGSLHPSPLTPTADKLPLATLARSRSVRLLLPATSPVGPGRKLLQWEGLLVGGFLARASVRSFSLSTRLRANRGQVGGGPTSGKAYGGHSRSAMKKLLVGRLPVMVSGWLPWDDFWINICSSLSRPRPSRGPPLEGDREQARIR